MNEQQLISWLRSQQSVIDEIIAEAADMFYKQNSGRYNFEYELNECQNEAYNLSRNLDLCYDRPLTPFVYSLWYQARRVNTFLAFFAKAIVNNTSNNIELFDLGAGTGAVQFSVALTLEAMKSHDIVVPAVRIVNIDSSPFMLDYNKNYLWPAFINHFPLARDIKVEYCLNSWNVSIEQRATNPWIAASYLFDVSDRSESVAKDFAEIIDRYKPAKILLLSSNQPKKTVLVDSVQNELTNLNYHSSKILLDVLPFKGKVEKCNLLRKALFSIHKSFGMDRLADWDDPSFHGVMLERKEVELDFTMPFQFKPLHDLALYNRKLNQLRGIKLSDQQEKAINFFGRQSIVIGPAGSGKSIVIAKKIAYLADQQFNYNEKFKILFTSFNKALVKKVGDWLEGLLDVNKAKRVYYTDFQGNQIESSRFQFSASVDNIVLLNFDLLPTRLGSIKSKNLKFEKDHYHIIAQLLPQLKADLEIGASHDSILSPEFILEEYHRIVYGLDIRDENSYLTARRTGMWNKLGKNQRAVMYPAIQRYLSELNRLSIDSIITRRHELHRQLKEKELIVQFDYILIDEFQDCTRSDFEIFNMMAKDTNAMTFAGDLAQAIHIGKAANIPKDEDTSRRARFYLEGSYRVPYRISECISPLSEEIVKRFRDDDAAKKIIAVKNSPPGARPIVVYGSSQNELVEKIAVIWNEYGVFGLTKITILEKDKPLCDALKSKGLPSETDTILRLKGLEKDCILWSTNIPVNDDNEIYEFVYTIVTRTSNVLIIAISEQFRSAFKSVLGLLRKDRLIFFDEETKSKFPEFCETKATEIPQDVDL